MYISLYLHFHMDCLILSSQQFYLYHSTNITILQMENSRLQEFKECAYFHTEMVCLSYYEILLWLLTNTIPHIHSLL